MAIELVRQWATRLIAASLLFPIISLVCATGAFACSLVNAQASMANSVALTAKYWIASILIGAVLIGLEFYKARWPVLLAITVALLVFHPRWFVPAGYWPDCTFVNVEASKAALVVICLMLAYRVIRIALSYRNRSAAQIASERP
jgi:hypothetical protein